MNLLNTLRVPHASLTIKLLKLYGGEGRPFELLPQPNYLGNPDIPSHLEWLWCWEEVVMFGTLLKQVLRAHYYDAVLHIKPHSPDIAAEVRIQLTATTDITVKYCCAHLYDNSPYYCIGNNGYWEQCANLNSLPNLSDRIAKITQCKKCHYSTGMYCGKGLVGNGYCSGYSQKE
ncbi:hypothetical protein [Microcoleus phage My-WqHQDG]|nr:hypothetical protein [Microcoleus phage My-WqHQDG]